MKIKDNPDFIRSQDGAIINTNRDKFEAARRKVQREIDRDNKIEELEHRISELEKLIRTNK